MINRRKKLVHIYTPQIYFKSDSPEVGAVLGLLSEKLDIETFFDKFREKLKGYVDRKLKNSKYVICVVTVMEDPMKTF